VNYLTVIIFTCIRFLFAAAGNTVVALALVLAVVTLCWCVDCKQDRLQCAHNVTLRRVRVTIVVLEE